MHSGEADEVLELDGVWRSDCREIDFEAGDGVLEVPSGSDIRMDLPEPADILAIDEDRGGATRVQKRRPSVVGGRPRRRRSRRTVPRARPWRRRSQPAVGAGRARSEPVPGRPAARRGDGARRPGSRRRAASSGRRRRTRTAVPRSHRERGCAAPHPAASRAAWYAAVTALTTSGWRASPASRTR